MKIEIVAFDPHDGWAFITKEKEIFLLRPPYISSNMTEVSKKVVENAIRLHAFDECGLTFDNIGGVIGFLKEEYIKTKKEQGIDVPTSEQLREFLQYATEDVLSEYLMRAQKELIPQKRFDVAESIALSLLKLEKVKNNSELENMAIEIIEKCRNEKEKVKKLEMEISKDQEETWEKRFPRAVKIYKKDSIVAHKNTILKRGQLLPMGGIGA